MVGQQETISGVLKTVPSSPGTEEAILGQFIHSMLMAAGENLGDQEVEDPFLLLHPLPGGLTTSA